ncbi:hypothetical protein E5170_09255 [Pseudomonas atacamensis]|uniref:HNH endonuclease n=1 Tax=Pseudomonas atacamensis TaxID=2565368 RepID=A0AAQ2DFI3_9PSED|nr:hypothetical protein [Pseudomonas atacamensis]THF34442.1 hypothetical protein E5170_09255 [Pseudomonas atacamensis]
MKDYFIIDQAEMDRCLSRYEANCHKTIKQRRRTFLILAAFERAALDRFERIQKGEALPKVDLWKNFSNLKPKEGTTYRPKGGDIKSAFRSFLATERGNYCCYCQRWLLNNGNAKPIEHILPRESFQQYAFNFWNLAVACVDCNSIKKAKVWCDNGKRNQTAYPAPSSFTEMYHPRFHRFKDHVRFIRVQTNDHSITLYRGITPQGKKLCTDLLKSIAAKEILVNGNINLKHSLEVINQFETQDGSELETAMNNLQAAFSKSAMKVLNR